VRAGSRVAMVPPAPADAARAHFQDRLAFEADPADVAADLAGGTAGFTLVDCRTAGNYAKAHLPGAVSLPWAEITPARVRQLPEGLLITYCWGPSCNAATKGAMLLAAQGRQVKELIGGLEYWLREGHPTEGRRPVQRGQEQPSDWGLTA
jgi:rhodanese-related sulfurtransferase